LRAERDLGRISAEFDTDAAAALLLGGCPKPAFFDEFLGRPPETPPVAANAAALVEILLAPAEARAATV
jgi:hypothetical protein